MEIPLNVSDRKGTVETIERAHNGESSSSNFQGQSNGNAVAQQQHVQSSTLRFKVYKRRWFGLMQLTLLNIIVSWDVSTPETLVLFNAVHHESSYTNWSVVVDICRNLEHRFSILWSQ
jgi:hypothetical protein